MIKDDISVYQGGWFIGDFTPSLFQNEHLEVAVKFFKKGDMERSHKQILATEITVVSYGTVRLGELVLGAGEILIIPPGKFADFEALTDGALTCVKFPSIPSDKVFE